METRKDKRGRANVDNALSAWRAQVAEAANDPGFRHGLLNREGELLPQFASQYAKLSALPRRMRRTMQRQCRKSLAGIALLLALGAQPAVAATINVGGACTLPRAVTSANNNTAVGGCARGRGADTIVLPANSTQTLTTVNNNVFGPNGLPVIRSFITIEGNGSTIRRAASAPRFRIFAVGGNGELTLRRTRVSGGHDPARLGTGGIFNIGSVNLLGSTISGNTGDGVFNDYVCCDYYGELHAFNSTFSGNSGAGMGDFEAGGVYLYNSTVAGNGRGGVFVGRFTSLDMTDSTVSGNRGAGVEIYASGATITNSTISGNLGNGVESRGYDSETSIINSTITGNRSPDEAGGGARNDYGSTLILTRTLISGNSAPNGSEVYNHSEGTVTAGDFNLFGHSGLTNAQAFENFTPGATDITSTSDGNGPMALSAVLNTTLANNGGPTRTHALVAGSPAVDAVTNVDTCPPPALDQRGVSRPRDGDGDGGSACDTGSFER